MSLLARVHEFIQGSDLRVESLRAAPAVGGAATAAVTLNEWVATATLVYLVVQGLYLLRKWYREEKDWRGRKRLK